MERVSAVFDTCIQQLAIQTTSSTSLVYLFVHQERIEPHSNTGIRVMLNTHVRIHI